MESVPSLSRRKSDGSSLSAVVGLLLILSGGGVFFCSLMAALAFALGLQSSSGITWSRAVAYQQATAVAGLGLALGLMMAAEGLRLRQGIPSAPFPPRWFWLLWPVFLIFWATGTVLSFLENTPPLLMAVIHAPTLVLTTVLVLGVIGWILRRRRNSWSDVVGGLLSGAFLGTGVAVIVELTLIALLAALLIVVDALPREWLQQAPKNLMPGPSVQPDDLKTLRDLLNPTLLLVALAFVSGIVPLVEEITKTLGIGLAGPWLRPSPARAFMLGVASGAGFALMENALNSLYSGPIWGAGIAARLAATVMHCATGGLMGWGWGQFWSERRFWRLPLALAGAITLHSLWNLTAVGAGLTGLLVLTHTDQPVWVTLGGLAALGLASLQFLLAIAVAVATLWAAYQFGRKG